MVDVTAVAVPTLAGARLVLRGIRPDDLETFLGRERDPEIVRMRGGEADTAGRRPPPEVGRRWYESMTTNPNPWNWVIDVGGRHAGSCSLFDPVECDRRVSYAIGIDEPALLGQGLGREATGLVLTHAFGPAGLHRVDLRVLEYNTRAIASYRACGFVEEGRQREAALVDGTWHDFILMSILESDQAPGPSPGPEGRPDRGRL
jgi:ribosomal-protein-alanine N-acetyltransferase